MLYPYFNRAPRCIQIIEKREIELDPAPSIGQKPEINWVTVLLPGLGTVLAMGLITLLTGMSPISLMFTAPMMIIGIAVSIINYQGQKKRFHNMQELRKVKYQDYLHSKEERIKETIEYQRNIALYNNPSPEQIIAMAQQRTTRLWERMSGDSDFLNLRIGLGADVPMLEIKAPKVGFTLVEDDFTYAPQQLIEKYRFIDSFPICCDLHMHTSLGIVGQRDLAIKAVWSIVIQAAALHGYDQLRIVGLFPENERHQWEWMRWLPHTYNKDRSLRFLVCKKYEARQVLAALDQELRTRDTNSVEDAETNKQNNLSPHYLCIVADSSLIEGQSISEVLFQGNLSLSVSCIFIAGHISGLPYQVQQIIEIASSQSGSIFQRINSAYRKHFLPDDISLEMCDKFARTLAPLHLPDNSVQDNIPSTVTFLQGYHMIRPEQLELADYWQNASPRLSMAVPIGRKADGTNFYFDINEKKDGPNGLVAGMVGSGKSEMLQSWILSMAVQFSPQQVSFVLIDFKGTGLILPFRDLPHLAGTISDLDTNITRNLLALQAEKQRRKALFDRYKVQNMVGYLKLYEKGQAEEPIPYLVIVIDEYAEFKSQFPDFTSEIDSLIRTGRALGICVVLATQNPTGIITQQTEYNIKFRWCLRVASTAASKEVLGGHDDAAHISNPGRAVVRVGVDEKFELIQSFFSGAPYQERNKTTHHASHQIAAVGLQGQHIFVLSETDEKMHRGNHGTEIDAVVSYIRAFTQKANIPDSRRIWFPQMAANIYLPELLTGYSKKENNLSPIIGLSDDPKSQTQQPLALPLSEDGHAVICGAAGSGKTTFLQTLTMALCTQYTPDEVNIYLMDFGAWTMGIFRDYPHIGGIAFDNEEEKINRMVRLIEDQLDERRKNFGQLGVASVNAFREATGDKLPYIVLLLDNFATVYSLYPGLEGFFQRLAREGGSYGVYFVLTANNKNAIGYRLSSNVKTTWALQMPNKADYLDIVGRTEGLEPEKTPGRGLCNIGRILEFQTALPVDGVNEAERATTIRKQGANMSLQWKGERAKPIPIMPETIQYASIHTSDELTLGLSLNDIKPIGYSFGDSVSLMISSTRETERIMLLHMIARQLASNSASKVYAYELNSVHGVDVEQLPDNTVLDDTFAALSQELKARQEKLRQDETSRFAPIYLLINEWDKFIHELSDDSTNRLRALQKLGKGLGVYFIIADQAEKFDLLQHTEGITMTAIKGDVILLGGSAKNHLACMHRIDQKVQNETLDTYQGYLCMDDNYIALQFMVE